MERNSMTIIAAIAVMAVAVGAVAVFAIGGNGPTEYTVTLNAGENCREVENYDGTFKVKSGTSIDVDGNELTIGGTVYTAVASDSTYVFDGWNVDPGSITSDLSLEASFSAAAYTLTISVGGNCAVEGYEGPAPISKGDTVTVAGETLTIGAKTWTAAYSGTKANHEFNGWGIQSGKVAGNIAVSPSYTEYEDQYELTLVIGDNCTSIEGYEGPVTVPYGTALSADGVKLTVGGKTYTAHQMEPSSGVLLFDGWDVPSSKMISDVTMTASFTPYESSYDLTIVKGDHCSDVEGYTGAVEVPTGSVIETNGTSLNVDGKTYTAVCQSGYPNFLGWGIRSGTVMKQDLTLTAAFSDKQYDFTVVCLSGTPDVCTVVPDGSGGYTVTFGTVSEDSEYAIYGELTGNIVVDAGDDRDFKLVLGQNGESFTLNAQNLAPIVFTSVKNATISVPTGTVQTVNDTRAAPTASTDEIACICARGDLDIQGRGALNVVSSNNNGIRSTADLYIKNLTLSVTSVDNPLKGDDSVTVHSGSVTLNATKGDGIKTENYASAKKTVHEGDVVIGSPETSPSVTITAYYDGIDAAYDVRILSGTVSITDTPGAGVSDSDSVKGIKSHNVIQITGGSVTVTSYQDCLRQFNTDDADNPTQGMVDISGGTLVLTSSVNDGLCSDGAISVSGGSISITCGDEGVDQTGEFTMVAGVLTVSKASDDGLKSDTGVTISGTASVDISASDDGINQPHISVEGGTVTVSVGKNPGNKGIMASSTASSTLTISGGTITVKQSYEGVEVSCLTVSGGVLVITSSDDGVNSPYSSGTLEFSGGNVYIHADGDGIDCNGTSLKCVKFSGANVIVVSTTGNNSALDVDGTYSYTGGTVALICPNGMTDEITRKCAESFSNVATQNTSISSEGWITCSAGGTVKAVYYSDVHSGANPGPGPGAKGIFAAFFGSTGAEITLTSQQPSVSGLTQIGDSKAYVA